MRFQKRAIFAVVACVCGLLAPPAAAEDPDASAAPRTSGPLVGLTFPCQDNGPARPGQAKGQSCTWSYDLIPAELSPTEDFSAYWVQMELDPGRGWCAQKLIFQLDLDEGRIVSAVPDRSVAMSDESPTVAELVVDGGGAAPVPGTVAQDVMVTSGSTTVRLEETSYRYVWEGNTRHKVVTAIGVQLARSGAPPEFSLSWSERQSFGMGTCRIAVIRVHAR